MKYTILVIDDNINILKVISNHFKNDELFNIITVQNSNQCLFIIKNIHIDAVICDLKLHEDDIDGIELISLIRENDYKNPIIAMTGYDCNQNYIEGVNITLIKPFNLDKLRKILLKYTTTLECKCQ